MAVFLFSFSEWKSDERWVICQLLCLCLVGLVLVKALNASWSWRLACMHLCCCICICYDYKNITCSFYSFYCVSASTACRARFCFINSVRLSINASRYCVQTNGRIVWRSVGVSLWFFLASLTLQNSNGNPLIWCVKYMGVVKNLQFSSKISVCLGNGMRWSHGFCGSLIGGHRLLIDPCQFQWPWKAGHEGSNFSGRLA